MEIDYQVRRYANIYYKIYLFLIFPLLIIIVYNYLFIIVLIALTITVLSYRQGFTIHYSDKKIFLYESFFNYKFGKRRYIPVVDYVLIRDSRYHSHDVSNNEAWVCAQFYEISLVCIENNINVKIILAETDAKMKTVKVSKDLSKRLNVKLIDLTKNIITEAK